eukprot:g13089.t1
MTTIAADPSPITTNNSSLPDARQAAARRRSSDLRAPPPGPPPSDRRQSGVLTPPPPRPAEGLPGRPAQPLQLKDGKPGAPAAGASARDAEETATAVGVASAAPAATAASANRQVAADDNRRGSGSAASALRRVSFSNYGGPPTNGTRKGSDEGAVGGTAAGAVGVVQPGSGAALPSPSQSLPQIQRRRRSSETMSGPGRPAPPRPPGNPPPPSIDNHGVRRYSITNEISGNNEVNFSRRMSKVEAPGGDGAPPAPSDVASQSHDAGLDETSKGVPAVSGSSLGDHNNSNNSRKSGERTSRTSNQQPSSAPEGRAAVLWYNMGVTKQKDGDVRGAVECYQRAARDGHAKAQHNLAAVFEKGFADVPKDDAEAVRLFRLAAEQGLAESSYSLAMHLKFGLGTNQDDAQCVYYLERASEQGLAKAMFNLGLMYEKRRGISPEAQEADLLEATRECYEAAAEAGVTKAMVRTFISVRLWNLALCYERGVGVARDPLAAQALQQQCRDREREGQLRRGAPPPPSAATGGREVTPPFARRRSSHPSNSGAPRSSPRADEGRRDNDSDDDNDSGGNNKKRDRSSERKRSSRRRSSLSSSSVPAATPPPPKVAPPNAMAAGGSPKADTEASAAASRRSSSSSKQPPYKYVPKADRPLQSRRGAAAEEDEEEEAAPSASSQSERFLPQPRERKNSLMLRPTPQAIARVKAAVERRKKLQAAAMASSAAAAAASAGTEGKSPGGPTPETAR